MGDGKSYKKYGESIMGCVGGGKYVGCVGKNGKFLLMD